MIKSAKSILKVQTRLKVQSHIEDVDIGKVCNRLPNSDPLKTLLRQLHPITRRQSFPTDPYSDTGCHFRILLFRNRVCHHGNNPFHFRVGSSPRSSLFVDPRDPSLRGSEKPALDELEKFWDLVNDKCQKVIQFLN